MTGFFYATDDGSGCVKIGWSCIPLEPMKTNPPFRDYLRRAVALAGSQRALAEKIGLSQQGISYLLNAAPQVSAEVAIAIERATEGEIRREQLRPDIFERV